MPDSPQVSENQLYRVINGQSTQPLYQLSPVAVDPRVQPAGNVQLLGSQAASGATSVAIGFTKPADPNIDHFEIWVQRSAYSGENPFQVASVVDSPAAFTVAADQNTVVIAFIRTIQKNGLATDLQASPTVTFNVSISSGLVPAANITAGTLNASVILSSQIAATQINAGTLNAGVIYSGTIAASQITAGTLAAGVIYSGTINASQVNAGAFSGCSLTLNLNGVTTTINNVATATGNAGIKTVNNSTGWYSVVTDQGFFLYDSENTNRGSINLNGNGGKLFLSDSSGRTVSIDCSASPSRIIMDGHGGFTGTVANPTSITIQGGVVTACS